MDDLREALEIHLLMWKILKIQLELLDRLNEIPMRVASPPLKVYEPIKMEDHL